MKLNDFQMTGGQPESGQQIEPLRRLGRIPTTGTNGTRRQRFRILDFVNASGTKSYRVQGMTRAGDYIRRNFTDLKSAQCCQLELETEWLTRQPQATDIRATKLSETQLRIAEAAFVRLDDDEEMTLAVNFWIQHGRNKIVVESPRLDQAIESFQNWMQATPSLRELSKRNLTARVRVFANSVPNARVKDIDRDFIEEYLSKRNLSPISKDNDRRALSRFFSWCVERPRCWTCTNPCRDIRVEKGELAPPTILSLEECKKLMAQAERHEKGRLALYAAVTLFCGLRPFEAARLTWQQVNLADGEIRLEGNMTKTGRPRVISIGPTLRAWLEAYKGKDFFPSNWRKDFDVIKAAIGYGTPTKERPDLKPWTPDLLRHTAISHFFRQCGSYGQTAEQFGNSEAIIKRFYQGRVSSEDTKAFFSIMPSSKKGVK